MTPSEIKSLRLAHGLTRHRLADLVGVSEYAIWTWETGRRKPHPVFAARLEMVLEGGKE